MGLDFDVLDFCRKLRTSNKPPYTCPVVECGKSYKSMCGLQYHLVNFDHDTAPPTQLGEAPKLQSTPVPVTTPSLAVTSGPTPATTPSQPSKKRKYELAMNNFITYRPKLWRILWTVRRQNLISSKAQCTNPSPPSHKFMVYPSNQETYLNKLIYWA